MKTDRILIFELNWMGDIIFSFPLLKAIRENFSDSYIKCVVVPRYEALLENNPWVDGVYTLPDRSSIFSVFEDIKFVNMIKKERFDVSIFLKPSRRKAFLAQMAGIKERLSFTGRKRSLFTGTVAPKPGPRHRMEQLLELAGALGISENSASKYEYFLRYEDLRRTEKLLREKRIKAKRIIAVNPGGNWDAKRWSPVNFMLLIKKILARFEDVAIVITGAKKDINLGEFIFSEVKSDRCFNLAGETDINTLAALFKRSVLAISADSGPMHLASSVGTTTIAIFGPTSPEVTGPRGKGRNIVLFKNSSCQTPCYVSKCGKNNLCMDSITAEEVFERVAEVLQGA